ncbi:hypothetical protein ACSVH5_09105 [Flavobacterium sp. RSSA_27]|uniref:hypothetical protein n=1 Tax=Flavobacterium sp. RSSA_27 TaxID=3447667 RepID=UPI003F2EBDF3
MKVTQTLLGFFVLLFVLGCSSDLDFDQVNDLELQPVVVANVASFDAAANQFVNNGIEQTVAIATPEVGVFNDSFLRDNVSKAELFFEVNNTINRAFTLQMVFLDVNNAPLTTIQMDIPAYAGTPNLTPFTKTFQGTDLILLKQTKRIAFIVALLPGPPLTSTSVGNLKLRSSVTAYFDIK